MTHRLDILFLVFSLLVTVPTNSVWACGSADTHHAAKFHHDHDAGAHEHAAGAVHQHSNDAEEYDHAHAGGSYPNNDGCGRCHCPGCGTVCHGGAQFVPVLFTAFSLLDFSASIQKQAFYFAKHLPEAVYLPIWQPPKLSA